MRQKKRLIALRGNCLRLSAQPETCLRLHLHRNVEIPVAVATPPSLHFQL
jgi:hypothetical protein